MHLVKSIKNNKIVKRIICICACLLIFLLITIIFINPIVLDGVEFQAKSITSRAMNSSVSDVVMNSIMYDDLVNIISDEFGNITMIQANSLEINNLSRDLAQACEIRIEEYSKNGLNVHMGDFLGLPILVGRGPVLKVKMWPIGSIGCVFRSQFNTAGINQTVHKIYVGLDATVGVVLPFASKNYQMRQEVLISESVIVGQVPEVYLQSDTLDTLLNFVPY